MFINHKKDLKAVIVMFILKKLIWLLEALMMIRDYKHMKGLKHIHMEEMLLKCVKVKCYIIKDLFFEKL